MDAQPCRRWGNLPGSPAISWHVELQQSLIPVTCPHCYTHEVAESTKPTTSVSPGRQCNSFTHLRGTMGRGHRSRQEQSSRSSASNSATCLEVICFPSPVLPSVKCQESDFWFALSSAVRCTDMKSYPRARFHYSCLFSLNWVPSKHNHPAEF